MKITQDDLYRILIDMGVEEWKVSIILERAASVERTTTRLHELQSSPIGTKMRPPVDY
jgi:hypothetical protein